MIKIGLPKGRMAADSDRLCAALGITPQPGVLHYTSRAAGTAVSVFVLKMPDVARLLRTGALDLGLTGEEWLLETGAARACRCLPTRAYQAWLCLLMHRDDSRPPHLVRSVATPYPRLARALLTGMAPRPEILTVTGSTEALVPDVTDACLDIVETGTSAALNGLVVRRSFRHVTTYLARSAKSDPAAVAPVVDLVAGALEMAG
jgi:ATP phosphoribosyltransferase